MTMMNNHAFTSALHLLQIGNCSVPLSPRCRPRGQRSLFAFTLVYSTQWPRPRSSPIHGAIDATSAPPTLPAAKACTNFPAASAFHTSSAYPLLYLPFTLWLHVLVNANICGKDVLAQYRFLNLFSGGGSVRRTEQMIRCSLLISGFSTPCVDCCL